MRRQGGFMKLRSLMGILTIAAAATASAQITPAAGSTPPDDTPSFKLGAVLYADWTYIESPKATDADGNRVNASSFDVKRAYLNATGNLNHRISFRITPDIVRESGSGSSLNGSLTFRIKYAFGQLALDDWTSTKGSWVRLGIQQTPLVDHEESIYRYRWQGPIFVDREGYLTSSDAGLSGHYNFAGNYGDVHVGFYNGDGYNRTDPNDQKAIQLRATVRPLPLGGIWKGLRFTAFYDGDNYLRSAPRRRAVGQVTFESAPVNAGFDYLSAKDRTSSRTAEVDGRGWTMWATPKLPHNFELLLRHDDLKPNTDASLTRKRNIVGLAYWVPNLQRVTSAVMLDYDSLKVTTRADDTRYALKLLISF
jgi:hypothetical protein